MTKSPKMSLWLTFTVFLFFSLIGSPAEAFDDSEKKHIDYPGWFVESAFLDLAEVLGNSASNQKKGLMVLFTTEGCSYCDVFIRKSLGDPKIARLVQDNFDSVGLEIFNDSEMTEPGGTAISVKEFAKKEKVEFSPTLLFYEPDGRRVLRLVGYQSPERFTSALNYVSQGNHRSESFGDFLKRGAVKKPASAMNAGLRKDPLFSNSPYALDRSRFPANHPLLVIYERQGCEECDEFHSKVLKLTEVRDLLRHFEIVRLDANDSMTPVIAPDGQKTTPSDWYAQTGLSRTPALAFYDEKGNQVLETDALVLRQRMMNSIMFVTERAYEKGWSYQRFARSKAIAAK